MWKSSENWSHYLANGLGAVLWLLKISEFNFVIIYDSGLPFPLLPIHNDGLVYDILFEHNCSISTRRPNEYSKIFWKCEFLWKFMNNSRII